MKGIVFNLLEQVITRNQGEDTWDTLLETAQLDGVYTSLGNYTDEDFWALVGGASSLLDTPPQALVSWFGCNAMDVLATRFPSFFEGHNSTLPFLLTLNDIIHPEVRKLYPGVDVPEFDFETPSDDTLVIGYRSARKLCALAEGFIQGATAHYGEEVVIEQNKCMLQGDDECVIVCTFHQEGR